MLIEEGIKFEDDNNNLIEAITFEDNIRECYKPVRFEDCNPYRYLVNPYGDIYDKEKNCLLTQHDKDGYKTVSLEYPTRYKTIRVHRVVATAFCPNFNQDEYNVVNHIDGVKSNNYYKNLEWCTQLQNTQHALRTGLMQDPKGELNISARFTNELVEKICSLLEKNMNYSDILQECGLDINVNNLSIISNIRSKRAWNFISDKYNIPEKEYRSEPTLYSDEQIHFICKIIEDGLSNKEIRDKLNINLTDKKKLNNFCKFIMKIRKRQTYTHISKDYKW